MDSSSTANDDNCNSSQYDYNDNCSDDDNFINQTQVYNKMTE